MLPNFIFFTFGSLFIEYYQSNIKPFLGEIVDNIGNHINFYQVLWPYVWSSQYSDSNKNLVICVFISLIGEGCSKIKLFIERDITNSLTGTEIVIPWGFIIAGCFIKILEHAIYVGMRQQFIKVKSEISKRLQVETFCKIHDMCIEWHLDKGIGEVSNLVTRGGASLTRIVEIVSLNLLTNVFSLCFGFYYLSAAYSISFATIVLLCLTILPVTEHLFLIFTKNVRKEQNDKDDYVFQRCMESLANFQTVKIFSNEENEKRMFNACKDLQSQIGHTITHFKSVFWLFKFSVSNLVTLFATLYGAHQLSQGKMTLGEYSLLSSLVMDLKWPFQHLSWIHHDIVQVIGDIEKTVKLLNQNSKIMETPDAPKLLVTRAKIEFENVSFSYNNNQVSALHNVSFSIEPGKSLALVGPTGSGKSTIAKLLTRLYDVNNGQILIDDQDIRTVNIKSLRSAVGTVPQEAELFNDKIGNNIRYARLGASDEEMKDAANKAELHNTIMAMDEKYETKVGNKGMKLSGGERQRIGIARVFLKDPQIVVLDEATSALDAITEKKIQVTLKETCRGKTSLVIAHRLSTISHMDRILVLDKGKVAEEGDHESLLKLDGMYSKLWNLQALKNMNRCCQSHCEKRSRSV